MTSTILRLRGVILRPAGSDGSARRIVAPPAVASIYGDRIAA
jgi:hypothetical protein